MNDIKVGQIWEHNSGEYSAEILEIDEYNEVHLEYSDGDMEWVDKDHIYENFFLPEEEHHVSTVDDAEAAFKTAMANPVETIPNQGLSVEDAYQSALNNIHKEIVQDTVKYAAEAQAIQAGVDSDIDKAEASYRQSVDSPLARVKRISYNTNLADLMVLGII